MKRIFVILMLLFSTLVQASIYSDEWLVFNNKAYYIKNATDKRQVEDMIRAEMAKGRDFPITFAKVKYNGGGQTVTCESKSYYSARWEEFKTIRTDCSPGDPRPY